MTARILIVDDNVDLTELIGSEMEAHGFTVSLAASGAEALRKLAREPRPDLILLDVRMPGMDGPELLNRIEKEYGTLLAEVPVLYSSGGEAPADHRISGFIDKMTDLEEYLVRIREYLALRVAA